MVRKQITKRLQSIPKGIEKIPRMLNPFPKSAKSALTSAPGSLVFIGEQKMQDPRIWCLHYGEDHFEETEVPTIDAAYGLIDSKHKNWINIDGLHETRIIEEIGTRQKLDTLLLEDILDTTQRPKCEVYDDHMYIVLRMLRYDKKQDITVSEQMSMVLGKNLLITFQEAEGDILDPVRDRIRRPKTKIRQRPMDYLAYALIDCIVDNYIVAIEKFGERIEELDVRLNREAKEDVLLEINANKREISYLRKVIRPVRELVLQLEKSEMIGAQNKPFLKDLNDHITDAIEAIETYRELLSDQLNIYNSIVSNRLNEIIRLLTIYSVIFIPLTFLAGIYGMNFKYFPELDYPYAYPTFWGVLIFISLTMIVYFKRRRWL